MRRGALILLAALGLALRAPAAALPDDHALGPFGTAADSPARAGSGYGATALIGIALLAGAGGWLLLRGRKLQLPSRTTRRLLIDETRSLGSRQYLVVASYEGKKLLLGVCPGRIDLLTPLDAPALPSEAP
jgi:flagellar protein FliO/FliZ